MLIETQERMWPTVGMNIFHTYSEIQGTDSLSSLNSASIVVDLLSPTEREEDVKTRNTKFILKNKKLFDDLAKL